MIPCETIVRQSQIVDIDKILNLPEPTGFCTRGGMPTHLRSVADPTKQRVVKFACKSWSCRICSARLRRVAGEHYATRIMECHGVLFADQSHPGMWETDSRRMRSKGTNWVRIGCMSDPGLLIGCAPSKHDEVFSDRATAIVRLGGSLRKLSPPADQQSSRFRPINASQGWRPNKKPKRFTRVGWVVAREPRDVVEKLVLLGIDPATIRTRLGAMDKVWDCTFDCPPERKLVIEESLQQQR